MQLYKTKDFHLSAALIATGCKLLRLEPENNFYWFIFESYDTCRAQEDKYWVDELTVSAKRYAEAIRTLKDRLFAK